MAERFSGAVNTALLGAFRPILVQYLWWDVEVADAEGRPHDVLRDLALLERIDPTNNKAVLYMAHLGAFTLAAREDRPARRLTRIKDAVRLLERAELRRPDDPALPLFRAMILTAPWSSEDPRLYSSWTRSRRRTPYEEAVGAMERAHRLEPDSKVVGRLLADKLLYRALELMLTQQEYPEAVDLLDRAASLDQVPGQGASQSAGARLVRAWRSVARGLSEADPGQLADGLRRLNTVFEALEPPGQDGDIRDDLLASAILPAAIDLGLRMSSTASTADVLSLVSVVHNIQVTIGERVGARLQKAEVARITRSLSTLVERLLERAPELKDQLPGSLR